MNLGVRLNLALPTKSWIVNVYTFSSLGGGFKDVLDFLKCSPLFVEMIHS